VASGWGRGGKKLGVPTANLPESLFPQELRDVPTVCDDAMLRCRDDVMELRDDVMELRDDVMELRDVRTVS
jgi:hypothetical protein